jgi:hypothetical protein
MKPLWIVNRKGPSIICSLLHRRWWFSNDWGTNAGAQRFEVECQRCGGCWSVRSDQ